MIKGTTRLTGIIGWPVEHSFSPRMHNAAFAALGLDYAYVPLPLEEKDLAVALRALPAMGFRGINVTIPHKVAVMRYLDEIDLTAQQAGAVNTVVFEAGRSKGYNTDVGGFMASLASDGVRTAGRNALLLGAGGAARAVVAGLLREGAKVCVAARSQEKAETLAALFSDGRVAACAWQGDAFKEVLQKAELIVNCTPVGMHGQEEQELPLCWDLLQPDAVLCDLIYNPAETPFLKRGRESGRKTLNGLKMLLEQGALAFSLWTGRDDCRKVMLEALEKTLSVK